MKWAGRWCWWCYWEEVFDSESDKMGKHINWMVALVVSIWYHGLEGVMGWGIGHPTAMTGL